MSKDPQANNWPGTSVHDVLVPAYVRAFQCQGPLCPETCCARWKVAVDKESFQAYRRITHPELKPLFKTFLKQTDSASRNNHGVLGLKSDSGNCGLLDEAGWCRIQKTLGEQALCNTCFTYPRQTTRINGQTEQYLTLSCPEAARLALTMPQAFEFTVAQTALRQNTIGGVQHGKAYTSESLGAARLFCVQLCQTEGLSLTEKFIALGWLCQQIDVLTKASQWEALEPLLSDMVQLVEGGQLRDQANLLSKDTTVGATIFASLFIQIPHATTSTLQEQVFESVRAGLELNKVHGAPVDDCYHRGLELLAQDGGRSETALSRYLLNEVLREIFPWQESSCLAHFKKLVARYGVIRLMLAGTAASLQQPLDDDTIVRVVHVFARRYLHSATFVGRVDEVLRQGEFVELSHLYALLR